MSLSVPAGELPIADPGTEDGLQPLFLDPRSVVISQYANSPVLLALLDALGQAIDRLALFNTFYDAIWNVLTANSHGLDIWGRIVGVSRNLYIPPGDAPTPPDYLGFKGMTDAESFGSGIFYSSSGLTTGGPHAPNFSVTDLVYRRLILAKAALNITNGSIPAINAILIALFPGYGNVWVRDNADMTMTFVFGAALSTVDYAIVTQSGVLPKPAGVSFAVEHP